VLNKIDAWNCPRLGDLELRGLLIVDNRILDSMHVVITTLIISLSALVVGARLAFGHWEIAWTVGSFVVGVVTLFMLRR
jgi:putative Mn2+ efflux pump MntP